MGFEPTRIAPVVLKTTDLTKLAYPRYTNISQNFLFRLKVACSSADLATRWYDLIFVLGTTTVHTLLWVAPMTFDLEEWKHTSISFTRLTLHYSIE